MAGIAAHHQHLRPQSQASRPSSDIELEYIVPPYSETASTRGLLIAPDAVSTKSNLKTGGDVKPPSSRKGIGFTNIREDVAPAPKKASVGRPAALPDYKPIPLRWPFQVALLVCIGVLMFFLEQVMRGLAGRIPAGPPVAPNDLFRSSSRAGPIPRALSHGGSAANRVTEGVALRARAQQITSTSAFPRPGAIKWYYGWEEPVVLQWCNELGHLSVMTRAAPFTTDDPTWCPVMEDSEDRTVTSIEDPLCREIKSSWAYIDTQIDGYDDLCPEGPNSSPHGVMQQWWPLPVVVAEGILYPLEISTTTDASGRLGTTTGFFPQVKTQTVLTSTNCTDGAVRTITTSMPLPVTWKLLPGPKKIPNATTVNTYESLFLHHATPFRTMAQIQNTAGGLITVMTWYSGDSPQTLPKGPPTSWPGIISPVTDCPPSSSPLSPSTPATEASGQSTASTSAPVVVPIPAWIPPAQSTSPSPPAPASTMTPSSPLATSTARRKTSANGGGDDVDDDDSALLGLGPGGATGDGGGGGGDDDDDAASATLANTAAASPKPTSPPPSLPFSLQVISETSLITMAGSPAATTITTTVYGNGPQWAGPGRPDEGYVTESDFWLASVVPVLLSTLLSVLVGVLGSSVRAMVPFRAMGRPEGAAAADSVCLRPNDFLWPLVSLRFLRRLGDPLPLLSDALSLLATVLVPLSSEILRVEVSMHNLGIRLQKSSGPGRAAEALLAVMAAVVAALALVLFRWRSGVPTYPWSMVAMASLLPAHGETRRLLLTLPTPTDGIAATIPSRQVDDLLAAHRFRLVYYRASDRHHVGEYGIGVTPPREDSGSVRLTKCDRPKPHEVKKKSSSSSSSNNKSNGRFQAKLPQPPQLSSQTVEHILDGSFFLFLCGLLISLFYYESTSYNTAFERFLDSQKFGVRALFATFGVTISIYWEYYLSRTATLASYQRLSHPQPAQRSIELSQPATVFSAIWQAIKTRDFFLGAVSVATVASKLTPILLANVPFRNTVTWAMHETGTWGAISVLVYMVAVLVGGCLITLRTTPCPLTIKPESLAACLYYVCDSSLLLSLEGVAALPRRRDRRAAVRDATRGNLYLFGKMRGLSGIERVGVDCVGTA